MKDDSLEVLSIDGRKVRVTNPAKPYFSKQTKLSKLDLVRYYLSIAPSALAGIRDRPLVLKRFVDGAEGRRGLAASKIGIRLCLFDIYAAFSAFYQKRAPAKRGVRTLDFSWACQAC